MVYDFSSHRWNLDDFAGVAEVDAMVMYAMNDEANNILAAGTDFEHGCELPPAPTPNPLQTYLMSVLSTVKRG